MVNAEFHHTPAERLASMLDSGNPDLAHQAYKELKDLYDKNPAKYKDMIEEVYKSDKQGVGFDVQPADMNGNYKLRQEGKDRYLYMGEVQWSHPKEQTGGTTASPPGDVGQQLGHVGQEVGKGARGQHGAQGVGEAAGQALASVMPAPDAFDMWQAKINHKAGENVFSAYFNERETALWLNKNYGKLTGSDGKISLQDVETARDRLQFKDGSRVYEQDLKMLERVQAHFTGIARTADSALSKLAGTTPEIDREDIGEMLKH